MCVCFVHEYVCCIGAKVSMKVSKKGAQLSVFYCEIIHKCIIHSQSYRRCTCLKCRHISVSLYFCCTSVGSVSVSSRLCVSVLLPGESSVQWKRIGSDIWQFDKVDLVSKGQLPGCSPRAPGLL